MSLIHILKETRFISFLEIQVECSQITEMLDYDGNQPGNIKGEIRLTKSISLFS